MESFNRKNKYPEIIETEWTKTPSEGQRVEVEYSASTNPNVWFRGGKFVNRDGFELSGILGWRSLESDTSSN